MADRLQQLAVFVRAAESGSFSRAARELGLSQPSVSRIVGELEERLGTTLLLRTTRRITLTHAGALFLERARELLAGLEDAEDAARGRDSLRGLIRLALPVIYGTREVIPRLAEFLAMHPLLCVEMTIADERQDLLVVQRLLKLPVANWPILGGMGNASWVQLSGHSHDSGADFDGIRWRLDVWNASAQVSNDVL